MRCSSGQYQRESSAAGRLTVLVVALVALVAAAAERPVLAAEPPQVALRLPQRVVVPVGGEQAFDLVVAIAPGLHVMAREPQDPDARPLAVTLSDQHLRLQVAYPDGERLNLRDNTLVYEGTLRMPAVLRAEPTAAIGERRVELALDYQGCSDTLCFAPTSLTVPLLVSVQPAGTAGSVTGPADAAPLPAVGGEQPADAAARDDETSQLQAQLSAAWQQGAIGLIILLVLLGLAMNLTPCVFPLLPITVGFFAMQGHQHLRRTLPLALSYVLGICLTFSVLGVLVALFGGQFGSFLASPWGVALICAILLLMAISLLGGYEIRLPMRFMSRFQGRAGLLGALLMGGAVGLVATPCVGPILAAVVIFVAGLISSMAGAGAALWLRIAVGAGLFFAMGLGLGLPYMLLGIFSGQIKRIPHGGGWLMWVKRLLALPVLAMVLYFLQPYLRRTMFMVLLAALLLAGGLYLGLLEGWTRYPWSRRFTVLRVLVAMLLAGGASYIVAREVLPDDRLPALVWQEYTPEALEAAQAEGRPAIVYFTADWCQICRWMEAGLFREASVHRATEGMLLLKVDLSQPPSAESAAAKLKASADVAGPPTLLFINGRGGQVDRIVGEPSTQRLIKAVERAKMAPADE